MSEWGRVSKKKPCKVCGKPDYCTYAPNGALCCMRIESETPMANGGWRHWDGQPIDYSRPPRIYNPPPLAPPPLDAWAYWERYLPLTTIGQLDELGASLGLSGNSLELLGCVKIPDGWGFPMHDERKQIIGIRTRANDGSKKAVTGSKSGIFVPIAGKPPETVFVCEGPSDSAAAIDLGLFPIGRPSCTGQEQIVADYVRLNGVRKVVICADSDTKPTAIKMTESGIARLRKQLTIPSLVIHLPCKDLREFKVRGGTPALLQSIMKDTMWS